MKHFILIISILASALFSNSVLAEGYWGVKAASVNVDNSSYNKDAINVGVFVGAEFAQAGSNIISLEGEFTTSIVDGGTTIASIDWSVQTLALYAAMRTGNETYLKVKAGLLDREITLSSPGASISGSDSGFSWGAGVGFNGYEIEYTFIDGDGGADLSMISLGYIF